MDNPITGQKLYEHLAKICGRKEAEELLDCISNDLDAYNKLKEMLNRGELTKDFLLGSPNS